jgi:hypothetical protein
MPRPPYSAAPLLSALACQAEPSKAAVTCPAGSYDFMGDCAVELWIEDEVLGGDGPMAAALVFPSGPTRYEDGAPIAVFVQGGWGLESLPLGGPGLARLSTGVGIATLYFNLPGGDGPYGTPGLDDNRGPHARSAVATALRYAAGLTTDTEGRSASERVPGGLSPQLVLASYSNGGNLAWATLTDEKLPVPEPIGVASMETPCSSQLALAEVGTAAQLSPLYEEGICQLDDRNGLVCDFDYAGLGFDSYARPETEGALYLDLDGNAGMSESGDFELGVVREGERSSLWAQSTEARAAADAAGLRLTGRLEPEDTQLFWAQREAPRLMPAARARFPQLVGMETGTEKDHVLSQPLDRPNVTGMVAAMQGARLRWSRLHAGPEWVEELAGEGDYADVAPNTLVEVGDMALPMQPEEGAVDFDYLTAAVLELFDRDREGDWGE